MKFPFTAPQWVVTCAVVIIVQNTVPALAAQSPIVVTATRTAETADATLASVTVIDRADIERQQAHSVGELLRGVPGISVSNSGGLGKVTAVFMRGTESDHTLVLIDGVKVGSATVGTAAFQDIPPEQIERIEIVRGPRSSLYGSEAIGGVIQIFTRKGSGPMTPSFSAGAGSHNSYRLDGGASGGADRAWYNLHLAYEQTDGFNACTGDPVSFAGCATIEPDNDGYENRSVTLGSGYRFSNGAELSFNFLRTDGDTEFDGSFQNESDTIQQVAGAKLRYAVADIWDLSLHVGRNRDESNNLHDGVFSSRFDTQRDSASLQNDISIGDTDLLTLGFDYQNDKVRSNLDFSESSRDNKGIFIQYQGQFGSHGLVAALRHDDNEQFNSEVTGNIAWGYTFANRVRLSASYGTAFKAPTFNELYFPGFGNPDLDPEESQSYEVAVVLDRTWGSLSLNAYQTDIDDLIGFDAVFVPVNIDKARIRGLEAQVKTRLWGWELNTSVTLMDPENRGEGSNKGNQLVRRPERSLRVDADKRFAQWSFGTTLLAESERYDDLANTRKLGGYGTLDLRADYALSKHWLLAAKVANLFDKDYQTAGFFKQDGRNGFISVRYRPGG